MPRLCSDGSAFKDVRRDCVDIYKHINALTHEPYLISMYLNVLSKA